MIEPHLHLHEFRFFSRNISSINGIIGLVLPIVAVPTVEDVHPYIDLIRFCFTPDSDFDKEIKASTREEVYSCITQLANVFRMQIEKSYIVSSPTFFSLGGLLLYFLKWSKLAISHSLPEEGTSLAPNFRRHVTSTVLLLYVCADEGLLIPCDLEMREIFRLSEVDLGLSLTQIIERGDGVFVQSLKISVIGWLGRIANQLSSEKQMVTIPQLIELPPGMSTTRERIADITSHLCQYVHLLEDEKSPSGRSISEEFAEVSLTFLSNTKFRDDLFTAAFSKLHPRLVRSLINATADTIKLNWQQEHWITPIFWVNSITILTAITAKASAAEIILISSIVPSFTGLLLICDIDGIGREFIDLFPKFVIQLSRATKVKRYTVWNPLIRIVVMTVLRIVEAGRNADEFLRCFPEMFGRFQFNAIVQLENVDSYSARI
jgi:hypothetical protein